MLDNILKKMVKTINSSIAEGHKLPWHSPFLLNNFNQFSNPMNTLNGDAHVYTGIFNKILLSFGMMSAERRRGTIDPRFVPRHLLFGKNRIKSAKVYSNPAKGDKETMFDSILVPVQVPIIKTIENPKYDSSLPTSTANSPTRQIFTGNFFFGSVINIADTNLIEIGKIAPLEPANPIDFQPIEEIERVISEFPHGRASRDTMLLSQNKENLYASEIIQQIGDRILWDTNA